MKERIRHILREETSRKTKIHNMIKDLGVEKTIEMVGGFNRFVKITDIDDPMDFLHLFDDLDIVQSEEKSNWTLFRYKPKHNFMGYDTKNEIVYINYDEIWSFLEFGFGLDYQEIEKLTKKWLGDVYNLRGVKTVGVHPDLLGTDPDLLGDVG